MNQENMFGLDMVSIRLKRDVRLFPDEQITSPEKAVTLMGHMMSEFDREVVCLLNLDGKNVPLNCSIVSVGIINGALVTPREILKASILSNAAHMMLLHLC